MVSSRIHLRDDLLTKEPLGGMSDPLEVPCAAFERGATVLDRDTADGFDASLLASTLGWHEGQHDTWPWLTYLVMQVGRVYRTCGGRTVAAKGGGGKQDRVRRDVLEQAPSTFRSADVRSALPGSAMARPGWPSSGCGRAVRSTSTGAWTRGPGADAGQIYDKLYWYP